MSRGRDRNQLYVVTATEDHHDRHPDAVETVDPIEHLGNALNRSAAKTLATDKGSEYTGDLFDAACEALAVPSRWAGSASR